MLQKLVYENSKGYYCHPGRKAIFVGDYSDRGPKNRETLDIVRAMADHQAAIALMGNHEFNAILYNTKDAAGNYLREHSERNVSQHSKTVEQFQGFDEAYHSYIQWYKTLPLYYEEEDLRAVHTCWDEAHIQYLREKLSDGRLSEDIILHHFEQDARLKEAIEVTLIGKELQMPEGLSFTDKDEHDRTALRVKWWLSPEHATYRQYSVEAYDSLPDEVVSQGLIRRNAAYPKTDKPVFFGHYWLSGHAAASVYEKNVCCVGYSVAKAGKLVAYRWNGEQLLDHTNMHHVSPAEL